LQLQQALKLLIQSGTTGIERGDVGTQQRD
jgi:hypothetical protein